MGKISNVITMLNLLATGKKYSVKELSDILEVNTRMVRIYKEDLEKAGIFIETIRGPYGGYVLNQKIKLPNREFSEEEVFMLTEVDTHITDQIIKEKLSLFTDKISAIYKENKQAKTELSEKDRLVFNKINLAIKQRKKMWLKYNSVHTGKGINERIIRPYNMTLLENGWWVTSYCERTGAMRSFELKDIIELKTLKEKF